MNEEKKNQLIESIKTVDGLTDDQRSFLLELLRKKKPYGLVWEDKPEDVENELREKLPVLVEDKSKALTDGGPDAPNHALIEGDNLEALTTLAHTHASKIDVIYIDPPYNTGNEDFIYNDSFVDSEDSYRHSKWLSFMAKRLRIAKKLLSDYGVIFISIDDNEQANLRLLCDSIFGENNFVATYFWKRTSTPPALSYKVRRKLEYVLCYQKTNIPKRTFAQGYVDGGDVPLLNGGNPVGVLKFPAGSVRFNIPDGTYSHQENHKITLLDEVIVSGGTNLNEFRASGNFKWGQENLHKEIANGTYFLIKSDKFSPRFQKSERATKVPSNIIDEEVGVGTNEDAQKAIQDFGLSMDFDYAKPHTLISFLVKMPFWNDHSITVLDFFAGSGTTLDAVMKLNAEDGGCRRCILVTNNENGICEKVTYERNKRVINGYITPKGVHVEGLHANNLRYFRTSLIDKGNSHSNRRNMLMALTDVLCFKEDIYHEEFQFGDLKLSGKSKMLRYFAENDRKMLIIYDSRVIKFIVNEISKQDKTETPIKIFIYADGMYPYTEDFKGVLDRIELIPMPYAFTHAIKGCIPEAADKRVDQTELTPQEQNNLLAEATEAEKQDN